MRIKFSDISQEFIEEYDLSKAAPNGWIYFEILRGCYGLPQSGRLENDLLRTRLEKAVYYEAATTPGLWCHDWRPIQLVLLVDDFGIEYIDKEHALHLLKTLEVDYKITTDWEGTKFSGIDLGWDYHARHANRTCRISMKGYIAKVLLKYGHPIPKKPQLSPHKHHEMIYGAKEKLAPKDDTTPPLDSQDTKRVQGIVGTLLYYDRAVDNKLLVSLSAI